MFDNIAPRYDLLNHTLTLGLDYGWRRKAVQMLAKYKPRVIVDMATGTADFAIEAARLNPEKIIGIDISPQMLGIGREKVSKRNLSSLIELIEGDSEAINLPDNSVDAITVGFGVRNFEHLTQGMSELLRILRPGGAVVILEPASPRHFPMKQLFELNFRVITPLVGRLLSGDSSAYTYLPASVQAFPYGEEFLSICREVGFVRTSFRTLGLGVCACYLIEKP
ncbi:MAG: bifunctional demethylmenaquinone methyltransferase/2-methoxy-6-polyprenyl-1,4-benzoquinol methylase UbiE [Bacteroidetes bacterium]|nr:MAG: bifunctional demethylmenaquinone methyltransferase/2-methoxy-6-polyprenyl-1,4-benzoquinol methylase UbiE [Bacteroidota bacterium]